MTQEIVFDMIIILQDYLHEDLDSNCIEDILDVEFDLAHFEEGDWDVLANELVDMEKSPYKDFKDIFDFNDVLEFLDDL